MLMINRLTTKEIGNFIINEQSLMYVFCDGPENRATVPVAWRSTILVANAVSKPVPIIGFV